MSEILADCKLTTYSRFAHDLQRFAKKVAKPISIAFDEYGVWDETIGENEDGVREPILK